MDQDLVAATRDVKQLVAFRLQAILENIPLTTDCVASAVRAAGLNEQMVYQVRLAVDEACANVVEHAYCGLQTGDMEVACFLGSRVVMIRVRDWGRGFDPESVEKPNIKAPLEERTLGGLGLFLVKKIMDSVEFHFDAQTGNEIVLIKRLPGAG